MLVADYLSLPSGQYGNSFEAESDIELWDFITYCLLREEHNEGITSPHNPRYEKFIANEIFGHNVKSLLEVDMDISDFKSYVVTNYFRMESIVKKEAGVRYRAAFDAAGNPPAGHRCMLIDRLSCNNTVIYNIGDFSQGIARAYYAYAKYKSSSTLNIGGFIGGVLGFLGAGDLSGAISRSMSATVALMARGHAGDAYSAIPFSEETIVLNMLGFRTIVVNQKSVILKK